MKKYSVVLLCFLWVFCCLWATEGLCASSGKSTSVFKAPFSFYADNENICSVLSAFARAEGYSAVCSPELTGEMSGRFEAVEPETFLSGMRSAFGVRWYTQGRTLTFWHESEAVNAFLAPSVVSAGSLLDMLRGAGMVAPQLPVRLLPGQNLLSVNGPPLYVDQLRGAMHAFEDAQGGRTVMRVFPLRYAWAEDMQVTSMDSVITIPGVASILQAMASGTPIKGTQTSVLPAEQTGLRGKGLAAMGATEPTGNAQQGASAQTAKTDAASGATIIADARVNAVVITDAEYRMSYYSTVISELDKPVELVEIHAAIVDIDSDFSRDFGINWSGSASLGDNWNSGGSGGGSSGSGIFPSAGDASEGGLSFSTLYSHGTDYFLARVRALEEDGQARVLGKPSVLTMDNVQASLENTSSYYVPVSGNESSDLFKVDSGTVLKVTPHIIPSEQPGQADTIKLMVSVQDDRDDGSNSFSVEPDKLSPIKQTRINTQAIVGEGQSLLIGGYYYEIQSDSESGVPVLKNIPVIGGLFSSTGKKHQRMERLILITPRIVRMGTESNVPARVEDERFSRSPTQQDYEERMPSTPPVGGCARRPEMTPVLRQDMPVVSVTASSAANSTGKPAAEAAVTVTPVGGAK